MRNLLNRLKPIRDDVRTPTILQMEAVECGAASLSMILAYHGRWISLERLRLECGVSRDGSKASNILIAAKAHGLIAKGFKKEIPQLKQMRPPFIVFWNFSHYLVVEAFTDKGVRVNDPGGGRMIVSNAEFDESFTGVVLTFEKTAEFRKEGRPPSTTRSLRQRMRGTARPLLFLLLASFVGIIPGMANAAYSRVFLDNILTNGMWSWFQPLILVMCTTAIFMLLLDLLSEWVTLRLQMKMAITESARYFWHVLRLPMEFFAQRYSADIGSRTTMNESISSLVATQLTGGVLNFMMVVFYGVVMFKYDVVLTGIAVMMALGNLVVLRYLATQRFEQNKKLMQANAKMMNATFAGLQSIETIKGGGTESDFFAKWAGYQARYISLEQELASSNTVLSAIPPLFTALNITVVLCFGGLRVMDGALTIGMLITFQVLLVSFTAPVSNLLAFGSQFQLLQNQIANLDDVLHYPVDELACPDDPEAQILEARHAKKLRGQLELRNIAFGYSPLEAALLPDISLTILPGQRVALVGGSGSGKSTVARLVAGLLHPWRGDLLFDGRSRLEHGRIVICNSIGCVDQDIALFDGTIRDNITLWDNTIEDARVVRAAKDACIHDFITSLKGNYEHHVEEGGRNLSGGQRQRLEIARALVMEPSLLVLDEATSALDPVTEKLVMDSFRRRGCSCLIVAHRLSTIRDCDEIIVLESGRIMQRGTHDDLVRQNGPYARLIGMDVERVDEIQAA